MDLGPAFAQQRSSTQNKPQEVYLTFRYKRIIDALVPTYYWNGTFYLPLGSLFSLLKINYKEKPTEKLISGFFIKKKSKYQIDLKKHIIFFNHQSYSLNKKEYLTGKLDYYFAPTVFQKVFGLNFKVSFSKLNITLETQEPLPVTVLYEQEQKESQLGRHSFTRPHYPVRFKERRALLNGGFMDYNLSMNMNKQGNIYGYYGNAGIEVLGGDFQTSLYGSYSHGFSNLSINNIHWRYVFPNNPLITQVDLGQLSSSGLYHQSYEGIDVTNVPVRFRYSFTPYYYRGTAEPNSQVQLYINGLLFAIKKVDQSGRFFFKIPLSYGSSFVRLKIYGPNGTLRTTGKRIYIPYSYLKPGEVTYFVDAGRLQNRLLNESRKNYLFQSGISTGITKWITDKIGVDYLNTSLYNKPVFYNAISARISNEYLTNLEIAPQTYYKFNMNVTYPSLAGIQIGAAHYISNKIYNTSNLLNNLSTSFYFPFHIRRIPFTINVGGNESFFPTYRMTSYNSNLYAQFLGTTCQIGYFSNNILFDYGIANRKTYLETAISHSFGYGLHFLSGTNIRSSVYYTLSPGRFYNWSINLFKSFMGKYQFNIGYSHNFQSHYSSLNIGFRINFDKVDESTRFSSNSGYSYVAENINGSLGYDSGHHQFTLYNRPEVENAAASVRMFVDSNGNGKYDRGETIIKNNAVQLWRMTTSYQDKAGITHYFSLAPYNKYNAKINMNLISNPLLLPKYKTFAFVTAANTFKKIDIPFYMTGVISGNVTLHSKDTTETVAGLNIYIVQKNGTFKKTLTTFNDGSYYSMGIPVGSYKAYVDSTQLEFLKAKSIPNVLNFKVKAEKDGDYVDKLNFTLQSVSKDSTSSGS